MKYLLVTVCFLALAATSAMADGPHMSYGPVGNVTDLGGDRDEFCQYGFGDDTPGSGWTLGLGQQLGINCPGQLCIDGVGFFVEFMVVFGTLDIVIYDGGTEVRRVTVSPVQGTNDFAITPPVNISNGACIMLCPNGDYWSVTGEDYTSAPYGNTYWSNDCHCTNAFTDNNLTIWAHLCGVVPTEQMSWGTLKTLYR